MKNGRKWCAAEAVTQVEGTLAQRHCWACVSRKTRTWDLTIAVLESGHFTERRALLQREVRASKEELRQSKEICLDIQGACKRWQTRSSNGLICEVSATAASGPTLI